jgi:hypothetical protein
MESIRRTGEIASAVRSGGSSWPTVTRWCCRRAGCSRFSTRSVCYLPAVRRVATYCLPRNLRRKSVDELRELAAAGLSIAYVGAESGDDEVLERVNKGETFESTRAALVKLGAAGITRSVMILNGLAGPDLSLAARRATRRAC